VGSKAVFLKHPNLSLTVSNCSVIMIVCGQFCLVMFMLLSSSLSKLEDKFQKI
jgi:hypothetical protein